MQDLDVDDVCVENTEKECATHSRRRISLYSTLVSRATCTNSSSCVQSMQYFAPVQHLLGDTSVSITPAYRGAMFGKCLLVISHCMAIVFTAFVHRPMTSGNMCCCCLLWRGSICIDPRYLVSSIDQILTHYHHVFMLFSIIVSQTANFLLYYIKLDGANIIARSCTSSAESNYFRC